jgi:thiamine monophosphate synthase
VKPLVFSAVCAWSALLFLCGATAVALTARASGRPLAGLGFHSVFGALVPALALCHVMAAMGGLRLMTAAQVWLATLALIAALSQVWLGAALRDAQGRLRLALRPFHLSLMLLLAATAGAHAWLNRT